MAFTTCTPQEISQEWPCLNCVSEEQLLQALFFVLAEMAGYDMPADLNQLLDDAACFQCLSDRQKLQQTVAVFAKYAVDAETIDTTDVLGQAACIRCLKPGQVKSAIPFLLCTYFAAR